MISINEELVKLIEGARFKLSRMQDALTSAELVVDGAKVSLNNAKYILNMYEENLQVVSAPATQPATDTPPAPAGDKYPPSTHMLVTNDTVDSVKAGDMIVFSMYGDPTDAVHIGIDYKVVENDKDGGHCPLKISVGRDTEWVYHGITDSNCDSDNVMYKLI